MKKIIMLLTSFLFSISISINSSTYVALAESNQADELSRQIYQVEQAMFLQEDALNACALFDSGLAVDDNGKFIYPDSYAGRFIDDDGHLVIQVASSDYSPYEYLREIYPIVEFNQVEYSKSYLDSVLEDYQNTHNLIEEKVLGTYVDIKSNKIVVEVENTTAILKSKSCSDLPIVFKLGSVPKTMAAKTIHSGDKLTNKKTGFITDIFNQVDFSVGIGANYNGKNALVACGHNMEVGDKIYSGLTHVGTVSYVSFSNGSLGDFSIITMQRENVADGEITLGDTVYYNHGVMNGPEIGQLVEKQTENGGYCAFRIAETNIDQFLKVSDTEYVWIEDLTRAERVLGTIMPGDSGGGVFAKFSRDGRYYFCGVINAWNEPTADLYFTPVWEITLHCQIICI